MTYDQTAQKVGIKALGTVESNMDYGAVLNSDPVSIGFSIGFVQWFGTRGAHLLNLMKSDPQWGTVAMPLQSNLETVPDTDTYWNSRALSTAEGNSIKPILTHQAPVQNWQLAQDFEDYKRIATTTYGLNPDTDTDMMLLFFVEWHQSPQRVNIVMGGLPTHPTLIQFRDACLADPVLGQYPNRINTAYGIINSHDSSGVTLPGDPVTPPPPVNGNGNPGASTTRDMQYITERGGLLYVKMKDGSTATFYPNGSGYWVPRAGATTAPIPDPGGPVTPTPGAWVHPLPGSVMTSPYGPRDGSIGGGVSGNFHYGIDFSTPGHAGTIYAPTDLVITVSTDQGEWSAGTYVKGHTPDGRYTMSFNHMQFGSRQVVVGQTVPKGGVIGIEGATGNVTGRHLHLEFYDGNYPDPWFSQKKADGSPAVIDPAPVLNANGVTW